jgi:hypothetical protein
MKQTTWDELVEVGLALEKKSLCTSASRFMNALLDVRKNKEPKP